MTTPNGAEQTGPASAGDEGEGLYKYFPSPSTDGYKIEKFLDGSVMVTPFQYFNDPFEFYFVPEFVPKPSPEQATLIQRLSADHLRAICLADQPLNRAMWAYYASGYTGFVAEFAHAQATPMTEDSIAYSARCGPFGMAIKVNYVAPLSGCPDRCGTEIRQHATKHTDWDKEQEWRVFHFLEHPEWNMTRHGTPAEAYEEQHDGRTYLFARFKPMDLRRIIIGMKADQELRERFRALASTAPYEHLTLYKLVADPRTQELTLDRIENNGPT